MSWPFPKSLGNSWQPSGVNRVSSQTRFEQLRLLICISKDSETSCCYHNSAQKMGDARCPHELRSGDIRDMFCVKRNPCRMQLWSTLLPFLGTGKIWFLDFEVHSHIILDGSVSFIFGTSWNPCFFGNDCFATSAACVKECFAKNWTKHSQVHEAFRSRQRGVSMENALLGGFNYVFFFFWEMVQFDKHWYFAGELKLSTGLILGIDDEAWWFKEFKSDEMSFIWAQLEKWQIYSNL